MALLSLPVLLVHAGSYLPFISDDTFISLRYSRRLLDGQGLTWTEGPKVEGYTNLLWLLACAGLGRLGVDLVLATRILGMAAMMVALVAVVYTIRPQNMRDAGAALFAATGLALSGAFAVWAVGGLEQPFVAAFLAVSVALLYPLALGRQAGRGRLFAAGVSLGLVCLSRADGPVLCVGVGLGLLAALGPRASTFRALFRVAWPAVLMTGGQVIFRRLYYGDWVPNTARVKVAFTQRRLDDGISYVRDGALSLVALVAPSALALLICLFVPRRRPRVLFLAAIAAIWLGYVAFVGGDLFPARRHWVAGLIPVALLAAELFRLVASRPFWGRFVAFGAAVALIALHAHRQADAREPENKRARLERWEWDGEATGRFLREAFGKKEALLAVDPAGAVPYYSGLPAIDMLGLNDHYIARHPPPSFGTGWLGHELGDGRYVLSRNPDLVLFNLPLGSAKSNFRSGKQMEKDRRFQDHYRLLRYEVRGGKSPLHSVIWTHIDSLRIGMTRTDDAITIPGYLFASPPSASARLDRESQLVCSLRRGAKGSLTALRLGPGQYRITAGSTAPLHLAAATSGAGPHELYTGPLPATVRLPDERLIDLTLEAQGATDVSFVRLSKLPDTP